MTTTLKIEDFDLPLETEEEVYASLLRALQRKQGFGLFFVQCTPAQGQDVMARLREDLGGKRLATVQVERETTTLYDEIEGLWEREPFDVLFVQGLEQALYGYEDTKRLMGWTSEEVYSYSWRGVPPILNHLNQRRDKLRNHFPACFVFLVPVFVVDYFLQRAADFLDWRSGLFVFPRDPDLLEQEVAQVLSDGGYSHYLKMPSEARQKQILELKELYLVCESIEKRESLLFALGELFEAEGEYVSSVLSWDKFIEKNPSDYNAWNYRGLVLSKIGRVEEAIINYDTAIKLKNDYSYAYTNRANARRELGDEQGAMADYDTAIKIEPNNAYGYTIRGNARRELGDEQGAMADYDTAIKLQPDYVYAYYSRGNARRELGDEQGAMADYDAAIKLQPDYVYAYTSRGDVRRELGDKQGAIANYDAAIKLRPDNAYEHYIRGSVRHELGDKQGAMADYDTAIKLQPDYVYAYYSRGSIRDDLGDSKGAIEDYQKAAELYKQQGKIKKHEDALSQIKKLQ